MANRMSWEGKPAFRWVKMVNGVKIVVRCSELPIDRSQWTKELSAPFANRWWDARQAEPDQMEGIVKEIIHQVDLAEEFKAATTDQEKFEIAMAEEERLKAKATSEAAKERSVGGLVAVWIAGKQADSRLGIISAEYADGLKRHIGKFESFVGSRLDVDSITTDVWDNWMRMIAGKLAEWDDDKPEGWASETCKKIIMISRQFMEWLNDKDKIVKLPKTLHRSQYNFNRDKPEPATFSNTEVKQLLAGATNGKHKLILLLMLNCGMTQKDVATLKLSELDLDAGRLTRRRSKMRKSKASRLVSYKLWPITVALLKEHKEREGELALRTESGKQWVFTETLANGDILKSDNVATIFNNLKRKLGIKGKKKSLKIFRKTSATRIGNSNGFKDLTRLFLGQKEAHVSGISYVATKEGLIKRLDKAIEFLAREYGIAI